MFKITTKKVITITLVILFLPQINNTLLSSADIDPTLLFVQDCMNNLKDLTPHPIISITSDDDFISLGLPGNGTVIDPYRIENLNITHHSSGIGINIINTTKYCTIQNNYLETFEESISVNNAAPYTIDINNNLILFSSARGIELKNSVGIAVSQNIVSYNYLECIYLYNCSNSLVIHNFSRNHILILGGVLISVGSSDNVEVFNNTCIASEGDGILLYFSENARVVNNTCIDCYQNGIWLNQQCDNSLVANNTITGSLRGIDTSTSSHLAIVNNTISANRMGINIFKVDSSSIKFNIGEQSTMQGIILGTGAFGNEIYYNTIRSNVRYGVDATEQSDYNIIHHNNIISNAVGGKSQALDDGYGNVWYNEELKEGNYWSDAEKKGAYGIDGSSNSEDLYPLRELIDMKNPYESNGFSFIIGVVGLLSLTIVIFLNGKNQRK